MGNGWNKEMVLGYTELSRIGLKKKKGVIKGGRLKSKLSIEGERERERRRVGKWVGG